LYPAWGLQGIITEVEAERVLSIPPVQLGVLEEEVMVVTLILLQFVPLARMDLEEAAVVITQPLAYLFRLETQKAVLVYA
jgi:hypothetical protein